MTRARALTLAISLAVFAMLAAGAVAAPAQHRSELPQGRPPSRPSLDSAVAARSIASADTAEHAGALTSRVQQRQDARAAALAGQAAAQAAQAAQAAAQPAPQPQSIQGTITSAFAPLGSGAVTWALRVAMCESGYNPNAVNASSGAAGLFQFLRSTWALTPCAASSPFDPVANARAAAWLYVHGGPGNWQCR